MSLRMAFTAVGRDCPGIVAAVSRILYETGCNIEDSSMSILQGEFAMILIVSLTDPTRLDEAQSKLSQVERDFNLLMQFRPLPAKDEQGSEVAPLQGFLVSVYGADKPGIVYRVTERMAQSRINITDVTTRVVGNNPQVYIMLLEVEAPTAGKPSALNWMQEEMAALSSDLNVDISVRVKDHQAL